MPTPTKDTLILTTPRGHEVTAELDYEQFTVRHAKVVNHYTGVIRQLDAETADTLARALKARQVYEAALAETHSAEQILRRYSGLSMALGENHPAVEPYRRDADQHKTIARDMYTHARHFHDAAMQAIDKIAGD